MRMTWGRALRLVSVTVALVIGGALLALSSMELWQSDFRALALIMLVATGAYAVGAASALWRTFLILARIQSQK